MTRPAYPFGTRKIVKITKIEEGDSFLGVVCAEGGESKWCQVLILPIAGADVEVGQERTIVYSASTQDAGIWRLQAAPARDCEFPGRCLMPGPHHPSECHTVEMIRAYEEQFRR